MNKILVGVMSFAILAACNNKTNQPVSTSADTTTAVTGGSKEIKAAEIADAKYVKYGKHYLSSFSKGDMDDWLTDWADDGVFVWNNGDSVAGKASIAKYWKERWANLDTIIFVNDIWLPLQVNKPQSVEAPGNWLLGWYTFDEKFKNGHRVVQWAHDDIHFNSNEKIDRQVHYVDMAPINAAMKK